MRLRYPRMLAALTVAAVSAGFAAPFSSSADAGRIASSASEPLSLTLTCYEWGPGFCIAEASYGTGPYTYTWYGATPNPDWDKDGSLANPDCYYFGYPVGITVIVTDAAGATKELNTTYPCQY